MSDEVLQLRAKVQENPLDFASWTAAGGKSVGGLLGLVAKDEAVELDTVHSTFNSFLQEFPLCFGYWHKYAETVKKHSGDVDAVYERGVVAVRHSVEIWQRYLTYKSSTSPPVEEMRSLYERAIDACGTDPRKENDLWDRFIQFETGQSNHEQVAKLYRRLFAVPSLTLEERWKEFNEFVKEQSSSLFVTAEEISKFKSASANQPPEEQEAKIKASVVALYEGIKQAAEAEIQKRAIFESKIKRAYFHVKVLDDLQLSNWREYLDFEEDGANQAKVEKLYERCLVACANYSEFWMRYATWKGKSVGITKAFEVCDRASTIFLKHRSDMHFFYASLLERHGTSECILKARTIYKSVSESVAPGLVESHIKFSSFERRQGNLDASSSILEAALAAANASTRPFLSMQVARFQHKVLGNIDKARETYKAAIEQIPQNLTLWSAFINFEFSIGDAKSTQASVKALYTEALSEESKLGSEDQQQLWTHFLDYLEDFGTCAKIVEDAKDAYKKWSSSEKGRKRSLENGVESQNKQARQSYTSDPQSSAASAGYGQYAYAQQAATYPYSQAPAPAPAPAATPGAAYNAQAYQQPSAGYNQVGYQQQEQQRYW